MSLLLGRRPVSMQVAALCLDGDTGKVLLITSRGTGRWVIPKGWPMAGRTLARAAEQEAWEEAGVRGQINHAELGRYSYDKDQDSGFSVPVEVRVFVLNVSSLAETFPEDDQRNRQWFSPVEAAQRVREPGLKQILLGLSRGQSPDANITSATVNRHRVSGSTA
ncbi:NUDIX hydrolase [Paracoccus amoyensis]